MAKGKKAAGGVTDELGKAIRRAQYASKHKPDIPVKVKVDITGKGESVDFDFGDAVKLLRARTLAEERDRAAEEAEARVEPLLTRALEARRVYDRDAAEARRLNAEAEVAELTDKPAMTRLAEEAEARARASQERFRALDEQAQGAKVLARRRRDAADAAEMDLSAIEVSTNAYARQQAIGRAIEQAEAREKQIGCEEAADEIVANLTQITADYRKAIIDRAKAGVDISDAQKRLAKAQLHARRSSVDPDSSDREIKEAEAALEQAKAARQEAKERCDKGVNSRKTWRKKAERLLEDQDAVDFLGDTRVGQIQEVLTTAERVADELALEKAGLQAEKTINKLDELTNKMEMAGFDREQARQARLEAQKRLREAVTDDEIRDAQKQLEIADQRYEETDKLYKSQVTTQTHHRKQAEARLAELNKDDPEYELLKSALGRTRPAISMQERLLNAAVERDEAYANLAQTQQRWRDAMQSASASDDSGVQVAAENLRIAKEELYSIDSRIIVLQNTVKGWLDDDYLPVAEREGLLSVLDTVQATNAERETIYVLDGLAESRIKIDLTIQAKDEAHQARESR
ncbi:MAG: hypothetical protein R3F23_05960 [Verrucomicrobiia bacterium]